MIEVWSDAEHPAPLHYHSKQPCTIHHGEAFVARDEAARARLPQALALLKRRERQLERSKAMVEASHAELKMLFGEIITGHEKHGEIGVTTMASGAIVYWIPEDLGV